MRRKAARPVPGKLGGILQEMEEKEITAVSAMDHLGLKPNSFYKLVHRYEDGR